MSHTELLNKFEIESGDGALEVFSPIDGSSLGRVTEHTPKAVEDIADNAVSAFHAWRKVPAPVRGELVRLLGEELRLVKDDLG